MKRLTIAVLCVTTVVLARAADAAPLFFNGFETDIAGWDLFGGGLDATRVASGTNGITSASGSFHAENSAGGSAGNWGGYDFTPGQATSGPGVPFKEYITSVDIYLDVDGGWANNTRFDFSSAINRPDTGLHRRDFIFNGGFFDDGTGPGANTDRFVISASNNSQPGSAFAKNPDKDPIAISTTGWYTFQHHFYDNGAGILAVDMSILDASSSLVNIWTLSDPTDELDVEVGGNRYGWFDFNEFTVLAFDNTSLSVVPEPASAALVGLGGLAAATILRRRR